MVLMKFGLSGGQDYKMIKKKGFAVFFIFLVIMLILFASFFSQSIEMLSIGRMQSKYLAKICKVTPRLGEVFLEMTQDAEKIIIKE